MVERLFLAVPRGSLQFVKLVPWKSILFFISYSLNNPTEWSFSKLVRCLNLEIIEFCDCCHERWDGHGVCVGITTSHNGPNAGKAAISRRLGQRF